MITKTDALTIGKAILKILPEIRNEPKEVYRNLMRGILIYTMDNFWNTLSIKTKESFKSKENFYTECGWV